MMFRIKNSMRKGAILLVFSFVTVLLLISIPSGAANDEGPSFTVEVVPSNGRVARGGGITATVLITLSGEWDNQCISLSATGIPAGAYAQFTPENVCARGEGLKSTLTIGTSAATPVGEHEVAIIAQAENVGVQSSIYTLYVEEEADFSVNVNPARSRVERGETTTAVLFITSPGGFPEDIRISVGGAPRGVNINISPSSGTPPFESIITIGVSKDAEVGEHVLTIVASGGEKTHAVVYSLEISAGEGMWNDGLGGRIILGAIAICLIIAAGFVARS